MIKNLIKILGILLLTGFVILAFIIFLPKNYNVPQLQKRKSTKYWSLKSGSEIAYTLIEAKGEKKPFPIIFLQGGPGGPIYDRNIEALKPLADSGFDVYLYDQVGCGFSNRLENIEEYTAERHKNDLEEIVGLIGSEKVILIGQSWGAILAVLFAADNQEKVQKIIFTSPGPIQPGTRNLVEKKAPDSLELIQPEYSNSQANRKVQNQRMKFVSFLARNFGIKLTSDKEVDNFQTYLNSYLSKSTVCDTAFSPAPEAGGGYFSQIMTVNSFNEISDPRPKLLNTKIPVLVMKGQCDNQKWGFINEYLEIFPNHKFTIVSGAGHSISVEQPRLYLYSIQKFLSD
ncbi:MAG TPA: alpha/beta hydrolase [Bacteroidales bacterium]